MDLQELLSTIEQIDRDGPDALSPNGETSAEVMRAGLEIPGAIQQVTERFANSTNIVTVSNLASVLIDVADKPTPETANLIYAIVDRRSDWEDPWLVNHILQVLRSQAIAGIPWSPPESKPPILTEFLLHCLSMEPTDQEDNADSAVNVLWSIHNWASDRGGLRLVFSAEERQAFRDKFDEVGLEPKPILEALGED